MYGGRREASVQPRLATKRGSTDAGDCRQGRGSYTLGRHDYDDNDDIGVFSVPKYVDLGGRRHLVMNNFPLSRVIFKVNFPLSNDPLALMSVNSNSSAIILDFLLNQRDFPHLSNSYPTFCYEFSTLHGFLMLKCSTLTPKPNFNSGTLGVLGRTD